MTAGLVWPLFVALVGVYPPAALLPLLGVAGVLALFIVTGGKL